MAAVADVLHDAGSDDGSAGGNAPAIIASTITALHGPDYWKRRIALWEELKIFIPKC